MANSAILLSFQAFFTRFKLFFLLSHVLFYLGLFFAWPKLVYGLKKRQADRVSDLQITKALQMRLYLIAVFILFEFLPLLSRT